MRAAIASVWPDFRTDTPVPMHVVLFRDARSFAPFAKTSVEGEARPVGYFIAGAGLWYLLADAGADADARRTTLHEYAHSLIRRAYPRLPLWLDEGLAEHLSTFERRGAVAELGRPVQEHLGTLATGAALPLRGLAAVTAEHPTYNENDRAGRFYAHAWAFVHFLLHGSPDRRPALHAFMERCNRGVPFDEAFVASFGATYEDLDPALRAYIRQGKWPRATYEVAAAAGDASVVPVDTPAGDAPALLGWIHVSAGECNDAALSLFQQALAAAPEHPLALAGIGAMELRIGRAAEARAILERAVASAPANEIATFRLAEALLHGPLARGAAASPVPRARELLRRVVEARPEFAEALALLCLSYVVQGDDPKAGIAYGERARALDPSDTVLLADLARLYRAAGRREDEAEVHATMCRLDARLCDRSRPDGSVDMLVRSAGELMDAGKLDEAVATLRRALEEVQEGETRAQLEGVLRQWEATGAENRCVDAYNRAVEAANSMLSRKGLDLLNDAMPGCRGYAVHKEMVRLQDLLQKRIQRERDAR